MSADSLPDVIALRLFLRTIALRRASDDRFEDELLALLCKHPARPPRSASAPCPKPVDENDLRVWLDVVLCADATRRRQQEAETPYCQASRT